MVLVFMYDLVYFDSQLHKDVFIEGNDKVNLFFTMSNNSYQIKLTIVMALIIGIQWSRVIIILLGSRTFGPIIKILFSMLYELAVFCMIYIIIILMFTFAGRVAFVELVEFSTFGKTILMLFDASFGNYDMSIFDKSQMGLEIYGKVYLVLYMMLIGIVVLNFLIAILSETYSILNQKKQGLYLMQIISIKQIVTQDPNYSSMIYSYIPMSLYLVPVLPFLLYKPNPKLNHTMLHISYIPVLCIGIISLVLCSLVLLPFAYMVTLSQMAAKLNRNF